MKGEKRMSRKKKVIELTDKRESNIKKEKTCFLCGQPIYSFEKSLYIGQGLWRHDDEEHEQMVLQNFRERVECGI